MSGLHLRGIAKHLQRPAPDEVHPVHLRLRVSLARHVAFYSFVHGRSERDDIVDGTKHLIHQLNLPVTSIYDLEHLPFFHRP
jgi:hypothetical protein